MSRAASGASPVVLEAVTKRFGSTVAVDALDIAVALGQTLALIGPSGCGKSSVLRLLVGLVRPDEGVVRVFGEALDDDNLERLRRRLGYVIQEGGLFPHLSARGNVALVARWLGWEAARVRTRVAELAELTKLAPELLDRFPGQLSGGQRQRVSLMRALVLDPDVLLLDEPLGALDPLIRAELQRDLRAIFERLHKTVVLVTHDLAEAAYLGHELALMRDGRIVQRGPLEVLRESPADPFVTAFIEAQRGPELRVAGAAR